MPKRCVYSNGNIVKAEQAVIQANDQGLLFGYGVFETIRVYHFQPFMLYEHLQRLQGSLKILEIDPIDGERLDDEVCEFIRHVQLCDGAVRITVTKGSTGPHILFTHRSIGYALSAYEKGFSLHMAAVKRNPSSPLTYLKTLNYLDNMLAKKAAVQQGFDEALLTNIHNRVSECSASNIFVIRDSILYTPAVSCGLLDGIVRVLLITKIVPELGLKVVEGEYTVDFLCQANEIFITNSVMEIMPVVRIENNMIGDGKPGIMTKKIAKRYGEYARNSSRDESVSV